MKLAEVVAKFLEAQGLLHVFGVNGGANLHLIHGLVDATQIKFIPTTHECNAGFAADAYARLTGLGCAMATSGPGATNLVTAIATSYYDSVPVLYITGNVATHRFGAPMGVRCYGFQETPIVEMVKKVTKYATLVLEPKMIETCVEVSYVIMNEARIGPVVVDFTDYIQRATI